MSHVNGVLHWKFNFVKLTDGGNILGDFVVLGNGVDKRMHIDVNVEVYTMNSIANTPKTT